MGRNFKLHQLDHIQRLPEIVGDLEGSSSTGAYFIQTKPGIRGVVQTANNAR